MSVPNVDPVYHSLDFDVLKSLFYRALIAFTTGLFRPIFIKPFESFSEYLRIRDVNQIMDYLKIPISNPIKTLSNHHFK